MRRTPAPAALPSVIRADRAVDFKSYAEVLERNRDLEEKAVGLEETINRLHVQREEEPSYTLLRDFVLEFSASYREYNRDGLAFRYNPRCIPLHDNWQYIP
jgi:hypothetical protein